MPCSAKFLLLFFLLACFGGALAVRAQDVCAICGKPIQGTVYIMTDEVTGEKKLVCSDCIKLPRCSIGGLPVVRSYSMNSWLNGRTYALPFTPAATQPAITHTLTLNPR